MTTDPTETARTLRDRIAEALATADGWKWAPGFKEHSPTWRDYQRRADAVLAVLPPPTDRAAVLREAATILWHQTTGLTEHGRGARWAISELRRMAQETEAEPAAPPVAADPDCLFCHPDSPDNQTITRHGTCYARLDNYPAAPGHAEIVPYRHVESLFDLTDQEAADAWALLRQVAATTPADGWTIGVNEGRAAGRTVDHLHIHLIPRFHGDVPDPRGGLRRVLPGTDPDVWAPAELRRLAAETQQTQTETPDDLTTTRATNQRLNYEKQRLESELAAYQRAVSQWEISEERAYVPLHSIAVIAKAAGLAVPTRWTLHYERVAQAEAAIERVRAVLETEAVLGRTALDYRGLITAALMGTETQQPAPLRGELTPFQLLADDDPGPLRNSERVVGSRRLGPAAPAVPVEAAADDEETTS